MPFDLQTWKDEFKKSLPGWKKRLGKSGLNNAYFLIAASSFLPVIQAVHINNDWGSLALLGSAVGGNLLANMVQKLKDKSETEVAEALAKEVQAEPVLQVELDALLKELDALKEAEHALAAEDKEWFVETIQKELKQLNSGVTNTATLIGDGAIAQGDGAIGLGKNAIHVGDNSQLNIYPGSDPEEEEKQLAIYRRMVMQSTSSLPLRGVDVGVSDPSQAQKAIGLANVYVDLVTTSKKQELAGKREREIDGEVFESDWKEDKSISVLEATIQNRSLVLLGDPGGGKSTFVNYLAHCLAAHNLNQKGDWLKNLPGWKKNEANLIPIVVILRDFARHHADSLPKQAEAHHLMDFIKSRLDAQKLGFAYEPIEKALDAGQVIVLLDGLDEVPTREQRIFVRDAVRAFIGRYERSRFLVTCRVLSYQPPEKGNPDLRLTDLPSYEIALFDDEKIQHFVEAWYAELVRLGTIKQEDQVSVTALLKKAVRRPDLKRLAPNPLLLTVMALVHTHKGRLPDARALLYEETVEILLWRWEQIKLGGQEDAPHLRQYLLEAGRTDVDLKRTLWKLSYDAHARTKRGVDGEALADISELELEIALATLKPLPDNEYGDRTWAMKIVDVMKLRSGLLLERQPGIFTFPHRTFQEYLAGAHLATQPDFGSCACKLGRQGTLWREVILYAVGKLVFVNGELDKPLTLVSELCPVDIENDEIAWRQAWLAGDALAEIGLNRVADTQTGRDLLMRVKTRLKDLLEIGALAPKERTLAGNTLASLGDLRFEPDICFLPSDPLLGFVEIPSGKFLMGSDPQKDGQAQKREQPQHELELPTFWMAKYPVTVGQFKAFVEATDHKFDYWRYNPIVNHPIVSVSWYDALAYCNWLGEQLKLCGKQRLVAGNLNPTEVSFWQGIADGKLKISLPGEAEWEKAARGSDGRIYPWQGEFDPDKTNTGETGIATTSAVGCFPGGQSPYGLLDMSGNVWEWTRSIWGKDWQKPDHRYPFQPGKKYENLEAPKDVLRVLRGGSWYDDHEFARCAYRYWYSPDNHSFNFGFRLVLAPS